MKIVSLILRFQRVRTFFLSGPNFSNLTNPSIREKIVWSFPSPTFFPGWNWKIQIEMFMFCQEERKKNIENTHNHKESFPSGQNRRVSGICRFRWDSLRLSRYEKRHQQTTQNSKPCSHNSARMKENTREDIETASQYDKIGCTRPGD